MGNDFQMELVKALVGSLQTSLEKVERSLTLSMDKVDCACRDAVGDVKKDLSEVATTLAKVDKDQALMNERLQKLDTITALDDRVKVIEEHTKKNNDTIALVGRIFKAVWVFLLSSGVVASIGSLIQNVLKQINN